LGYQEGQTGCVLGGRMTKLTNSSIMEPPGGAQGSLRCAAAGQPPRTHPPPPARASRSQLHPPLGITPCRQQGGAHLDRRDPSRTHLGSASPDPGAERNGGEQRPGSRERCGEEVPGRDDGARREGVTTQEQRRRKERAGWNS
jgi:hypothetical protein